MNDDPSQLPLFPDRTYLQRIVPEENQRRFYAMTAIPTWFGEWAVMREWGRIGSPGTVRTDIHADEGSAITALGEIARQKQRLGYKALREATVNAVSACRGYFVSKASWTPERGLRPPEVKPKPFGRSRRFPHLSA